MNLVKCIKNEYWRKNFIRKYLNTNITVYLSSNIYCNNPIRNNTKLYTAAFEDNDTIPNNVDQNICEQEGIPQIMPVVYTQLKRMQSIKELLTDDEIHKITYVFCPDYDNKGMIGISGIGMDNNPHLIEAYIYQLSYTDLSADIIKSKELLADVTYDIDLFNVCRYLAFIINHNLEDSTYKSHTVHAYIAGNDDGQLDIDLVNNEMWAETINFKQIDDYTTKY